MMMTGVFQIIVPDVSVDTNAQVKIIVVSKVIRNVNVVFH